MLVDNSEDFLYIDGKTAIPDIIGHRVEPTGAAVSIERCAKKRRHEICSHWLFRRELPRRSPVILFDEDDGGATNLA